MPDLEELLEAIDEVVAVEHLALEELVDAGADPKEFACPHIERLAEIRKKFGPAS